MRRRREIVVSGKGARKEDSQLELTLEEELARAERDAEQKSAASRDAYWVSVAAIMRRNQLRDAVERKQRLDYEVSVALESAARAGKDAKAAGKREAQHRRGAEAIAVEVFAERCTELLGALEPARTRLGELQSERDEAIFTARPEATIARLENEVAEAADQVLALEEDLERAAQERSEAEQRRAELLAQADDEAAEAGRLREEARALRVRAEELPAQARREAIEQRERDAQVARQAPPEPDPGLVMIGGEKSPVVDVNGLVHLGENWIAGPGGVARFD